jgi:hypothetical protein
VVLQAGRGRDTRLFRFEELQVLNPPPMLLCCCCLVCLLHQLLLLLLWS